MKTMQSFASALLFAAAFAWKAQAQLAITEVMAESSTNLVPTFRGPDFWEFTNFGTNDINLHGFGFSDDKVDAIYTNAFTNLTIRGGESIVFCRTDEYVDTAEEFKAWWGEENLPTNLQVRFYIRPGLGEAGDQLWVRDAAGNAVDMVTFGPSLRGHAIAYDLETGTFGVPSAAGVNRAWRAATSTNDVGSPGSTPGPVQLSIRQEPASQIVDGCGSVCFSVLAGGVPRPRYQWTFNGVPILGETGSKLTLPDIGPSAAGEYRVILNNGFEELLSAPAHLTVNTNPLAPWITLPPVNTTVFPGQTGRFSVEIRGYPCVEYQWHSNGVTLAGETNRTLAVAVPDGAPLVTTLYTLTASNNRGTATASAKLIVMRRPCLQITEIMSSPTNDAILEHKGWFELTNCDTNEVNLQGYRFRDAPFPEVAFVITSAVIIKPTESIIFVESMSREAYLRWWGADRLPPDVQVVTWHGWGLSEVADDNIHFWNSSPNEPLDTVATEDRLGGIPGVSAEMTNYCDEIEVYGCIASYLRESVARERGAFRAAEGGDIGSPGFTTNPPPRLLSLSRSAAGVDLDSRVTQGKTYRLFSKNVLGDLMWTLVEEKVADDFVITMHDATAGGVPARFYRLEEGP